MFPPRWTAAVVAVLLLCAPMPRLLADSHGPPSPITPAVAPPPLRAATLPVAASTQPADAQSKRIALIAQSWADLAHRDPAVREAARAHLMGLHRNDLPLLRRVVADSRPLLPAQAVMLREIVTQIYLSGESYATGGLKGFLGVRPAQVSLLLSDDNTAIEQEPVRDREFGVAILVRMAGFCGARAFQDGDVVLGIVERPELRFHGPGELADFSIIFSEAVKEAGAGQTIHFQVLRQGKIIRVPVTLDPRPNAADDAAVGLQSIEDFLNDRQKKAADYWDQQFAPLLKESIG